MSCASSEISLIISNNPFRRSSAVKPSHTLSPLLAGDPAPSATVLVGDNVCNTGTIVGSFDGAAVGAIVFSMGAATIDSVGSDDGVPVGETETDDGTKLGGELGARVLATGASVGALLGFIDGLSVSSDGAELGEIVPAVGE